MVVLYANMLMKPDPHAAAVAAALEIKNVIDAAKMGDPTDQTWPDLTAEDANSTAAIHMELSVQQRLHLLQSKAQYSSNRRFLFEPSKARHITNCRDAMERLLSSQGGSSLPQTLVSAGTSYALLISAVLTTCSLHRLKFGNTSAKTLPHQKPYANAHTHTLCMNGRSSITWKAQQTQMVKTC
jgi:hypothetical protein